MIRIHSIQIGGPQTISDESGTWRSSIFRKPVAGAIRLGERGLEGDRVTDTRHQEWRGERLQSLSIRTGTSSG